jgi:integrase
MAGGRDPQSARQAERHEQTIKGLVEHWVENNAKPNKKTWRDDERRCKDHLSQWNHRKLSSISKADLQSLHAKIGRENGHYEANHVIELISSMFNKAGDIGYEGKNPAVGIKKFQKTKRDRFLHGDELRLFFQALAEEPSNKFRDFFILALLTGARRANVLCMRWEEIDFDTCLWRIPMTKNGLPVVVPLVPAAIQILQTRRQKAIDSPWVFHSTGSKTGHLTEPKAAWKRILGRAGLSDLRVHDLRRSMGSWQAIGGSSLSVIGKSLGHTSLEATSIYARLSVEPVRTSMEKASTAMLSAGGMVIDATSETGVE